MKVPSLGFGIKSKMLVHIHWKTGKFHNHHV
jgi:hypothetical protein